MTPRIVNALVGVWLFVSAFAWPHTHGQAVNTVACGLLAVVFALISLFVEPARYLNMALGVWLFLSTFFLPSLRQATLWNNAIMAVVLFVAALLSPGPDDLRRERDLFSRT